MRTLLLHYRLTLDVKIDPQGVATKDLKHLMYQVVKDAMNNGTLTGVIPGTVEHYDYKVERIHS